MKYKFKQTLFSDSFIKRLLLYTPVVLAVVFVTNFLYGDYLNINQGVASKEATLFIVFEGDNGRMFRGGVVADMTILDALVASADAGQIKFKYSFSKDSRVTIDSLDGYQATGSDKNLAFYLNKKKISTRIIDQVVIHGGDRIDVDLE